MKKTIKEQWRSILLTTAGVALVFGLSFLYFSSQGGEVVSDPDPTIVERDVLRPQDDDKGIGGKARPNGPVIISPSSIAVENASVGLSLPPINVQNQGTEARRVNFEFVPIYRSSAAGIPDIAVNETTLAEGRKLLKIEPQGELLLQPGKSLQIRSQIVGRPKEPTLVGSIGVRLIGDYGEASDPEKKGVRTRLRQDVRISSIITAVFPGGKSDAVDVRNIRAEATGAGSLRATVEVQSRGDIPSVISGTVLLSRNGKVVARKEIEDNSVLPGQSETMSTESFTGIRPGKYTLEGQIRYGKNRKGQSVSRPLQIASNGLPAVPEAGAAVSLDRNVVRPGEEAKISINLRNTGEKSFSPSAKLGVFSSRSSKPIEKIPVDFSALNPGKSEKKTLSVVAPKKPGTYSYTITVRADSGELLYEGGTSLDVSATEKIAEGSLWDSARDWISDNPAGGIALGIIFVSLLLFGSVGVITIIQRARR